MTTQDIESATDLFVKCIKMQTEVLDKLTGYYKEQNVNAMQKYVDLLQGLLLQMKATK